MMLDIVLIQQCPQLPLPMALRHIFRRAQLSIIALVLYNVYSFVKIQHFWGSLLGFLYAKQSYNEQGPVVQSVVSSTSLLVVKMLTVLVSTISNSQVFLLKK